MHRIVRWIILTRSVGFFEDLAGVLIEDQLDVVLLFEVEQAHDRTGRGIEGATAETLTIQPVVLDELRDRGLSDEHVVDMVLLGPGRDHEQRQPCARTATARDRQTLDTKGLRARDAADA